MPVLKSSFRERNPFILGVIAATVIALVVVGSLSASRIKSALTEVEYHARFSEAGGLREGDDVRVSGLSVGQVKQLSIKENQVHVTFTVDHAVSVGDQSIAEIKSATVLGRKFLQVTSHGDDDMADGTVIPRARTRTPFDVQARLEGLGGELEPLNKKQLANALDTVSSTLEQTPEEVRAALEGVRRASEVVNKRDAALLNLLQSASQVSGLLASRTGEVTKLVRDANGLLKELTLRRAALQAVLTNVNGLLEQLRGLAMDNDRRIGPALKELDKVSTLLENNEGNISALIEGLRNYTGSLGEAVNGGPWFYGYIANLVPSNLAQQTTESLLSQLPRNDGSRP